MSQQTLPSLYCLSINTLYGDALIRTLKEENKRYSRRIVRATNSDPAKLPAASRFWHEKLAMNEIYLEVAHDFITADFTEVQLCAADDLKGYLKVIVKESVQMPRNDYFEPEQVDLDNEQSTRITKEYKSYVITHSTNPIVELWTREDDTAALIKGFRSAPHQIFDHYMFLNAGLFSKADANFDFSSDLLANGDNAVWNKIRELYQLVINAPRAPVPLLLVRTVRNKRRVPIAWFETLTKRKMVSGDSIITPTFMSTSLQDVNESWKSYGVDAVHAEYDEYDPEKQCCIMHILVSKGVPMLPLGDFESNEHAHENEVLLPPGIQLVLLHRDGLSEMESEEFITTYYFLARVVPPLAP